MGNGYQRGGGTAPVHVFERLFNCPGRIRNLQQLVALHRLDPCRRRKMMVCVDAELLGSILRLRASGQEVRAAGGRRNSQCSNRAGQETSTVRYGHKSPPRILNRNFGFRPLACASYACPVLDTTNLPPERVAKSNSRETGIIGMYGPPQSCKRKMSNGIWSALMYSAFSGVTDS